MFCIKRDINILSFSKIDTKNVFSKFNEIERSVKQWRAFFNVYLEPNMIKLVVLTGFIIGSYNLSNIGYADDPELIANTEKKL